MILKLTRMFVAGATAAVAVAACDQPTIETDAPVVATERELQQAGPGGGPPSFFTYGAGWRVGTHPRFVTDVDKDGRADLIGFFNDGVYLSRGEKVPLYPTRVLEAFNNSIGLTLPNVRPLADVDGDGFPDIVGFGSSAVYVARKTASGFGAPQSWLPDLGSSAGWNNTTSTRLIGDVDGDGKGDIVAFGADGVYVARSLGDRFEPKTLWSNGFSAAQGWDFATHDRRLVDVNGDGRADLIGFGPDGVYTALSLGHGFAPMTRVSRMFGADTGWRNGAKITSTVTDVNGDTYADIVGVNEHTVVVALGGPDGFQPAESWLPYVSAEYGSWSPDRHPRFVADVNGDGFADFVIVDEFHVRVALGTGFSFGTLQPVSSDFTYARGWRTEKHPRFVADIDGNGKLDVIGMFDNGFFWQPLTPPRRREVTLPLCKYDTDIDSTAHLYTEPGVAFGIFINEFQGPDLAHACPGIQDENSVRPIIPPDTLEGQYWIGTPHFGPGSSVAFSDGSKVFGMKSLSCKRVQELPCDDQFDRVSLHGEAFNGGRVFLQLDGGMIAEPATVTASVRAMGDYIPPVPPPLVTLVMQTRIANNPWVDATSRTMKSWEVGFETPATLSINVKAGTDVRFQVRTPPGTTADLYIFDAHLSMAYGQENHPPLCDYSDPNRSWLDFFYGPGSAWNCFAKATVGPPGSSAWTRCVVGAAQRPLSIATYLVPAAGGKLDMTWDGGETSMYGVEKVSCGYDTASIPAVDIPGATSLRGVDAGLAPAPWASNRWIKLAEVYGGYVDHVRPALVRATTKARMNTATLNGNFMVVIQVLQAGPGGMPSWTAVKTDEFPITADLTALESSTFVPVHSDVRVQVYARLPPPLVAAAVFDLRDTSLFVEQCIPDPTEPDKCAH